MRGLHRHSEAVRLCLLLVRFSEKPFKSMSTFCWPQRTLRHRARGLVHWVYGLDYDHLQYASMSRRREKFALLRLILCCSDVPHDKRPDCLPMTAYGCLKSFFMMFSCVRILLSWAKETLPFQEGPYIAVKRDAAEAPGVRHFGGHFSRLTGSPASASCRVQTTSQRKTLSHPK